jgi:hypothetical protein
LKDVLHAQSCGGVKWRNPTPGLMTRDTCDAQENPVKTGSDRGMDVRDRYAARPAQHRANAIILYSPLVLTVLILSYCSSAKTRGGRSVRASIG